MGRGESGGVHSRRLFVKIIPEHRGCVREEKNNVYNLDIRIINTVVIYEIADDYNSL